MESIINLQSSSILPGNTKLPRSIVDAYDVMINGRTYKKAVIKKEAIKELKKCSGTQFDPKLADIFINIVLKVK